MQKTSLQLYSGGELKDFFADIPKTAQSFNRDTDAVKNGPMKNENIQRCQTKAGRPKGSAPIGNPFCRTVLPPKLVGNTPSGKLRREYSSVMPNL
ncbi:MAG: hypothetical protein EA344_00425 [Alkalicoccus sp.]|nr:MAG: hypothetical protein EA344_00425 [Alkalicoccus sp.]